MLLVGFAIYVILLLILWAFYAVARMHALKFKNFSTHITPVTNFLGFFLVILSIIGGILLFFVVPDQNNYQVSLPSIETKNTTGKSLEHKIVGEEYY